MKGRVKSAHPPNDGTEPYRSALPIMQINPWRAKQRGLGRTRYYLVSVFDCSID